MPAAAGGSDRGRALTAEGERRFGAAARGLARLVPVPEVVLSSPLLRARQTAALLAAAWGDLSVTPENALASGSVEVILDALSLHEHATTVALVGHEPTMSGLLAELIRGSSSDPLSFSPGAAAFVDVVSLARRDGHLLWFLPPAVAAASGP